MAKAESLITDNLDLWSSAIKKRATTGRGSNSKIELYGIKKLRELILDLAMRGLLVEQDPNDEPASVLLEKIESERQRLIEEKTIKKKRIKEVSKEEELFVTPIKWSWTRLTTISEIGPRNIIKDEEEVAFVPMPLITSSYYGEHGQEIRKWSEVKKGYTHFANGDIALAKITPCFENSKAAVFSGLKNGYGAGTTELHVARAYSEVVNREYILLYLKSPMFLEVGKTKMTGSAGQKRVPKSFFAENPIPFPPLAEQNRIVEKVNQLMTLCDKLEQQQESSITAHQLLVTTVLEALVNAAEQDAFEQAWQRLSQNFDLLFTTEDSIEQLQQTLLQLAVMGKLVPQDPNEEPASQLMERLIDERDNWLEDNKHEFAECGTMIRKLSKLERKSFTDIQIKGWVSVYLIELTRLLVDCHNKTAPYVDSGIPIIRTTNIRNGEFNFKNMKYISEETYTYWSKRCPPEPGDIMFTREAPMGEAAIIPEGAKWCLGQRTMLIRPMHNYINNQYLLIALLEPGLLQRASKNAVGATVKHLRVGDVEKVNIVLPPLQEQNRIVDKVNQLMTICEQLKTALLASQDTQLQLTDTLTGQAFENH